MLNHWPLGSLCTNPHDPITFMSSLGFVIWLMSVVICQTITGVLFQTKKLSVTGSKYHAIYWGVLKYLDWAQDIEGKPLATLFGRHRQGLQVLLVACLAMDSDELARFDAIWHFSAFFHWWIHSSWWPGAHLGDCCLWAASRWPTGDAFLLRVLKEEGSDLIGPCPVLRLLSDCCHGRLW